MRTPDLGDLREHALGERAVPADHAAVEEAEDGPQVLARHCEHLSRCAHAVVEPDTGIPHLVPDRVRHLFHVPSLVVQEDDVEVAPRAQLASPVAADRNEGIAARSRGSGSFEQPGEIVVRRLAVARRQVERRELASQDRT